MYVMSMAHTWFGRVDRQLAQQIRIDLVPGRRLGGVGLAIERLDAHPLHQRGDMQAPDREALRQQQVAQHPAARKRVRQMQFIHPPHDGQIGR